MNAHENQNQIEGNVATEMQHAANGDNPATAQRRERTIMPRASVFETPNEVVLELEMPGVNRESIDVRVENDELSVTGRRNMPVDVGYDVLHQERVPLSYSRAFVLSDRIDASSIKAVCKDGVLQLTLPKAAQAKPRKIAVE